MQISGISCQQVTCCDLLEAWVSRKKSGIIEKREGYLNTEEPPLSPDGAAATILTAGASQPTAGKVSVREQAADDK
jgi:hypothetical protein